MSEFRPVGRSSATTGTSDFYNIRDLSGNVVRSVQGKDYAGPPGGSGIGAAVGGLLATTPYTQSAPQDWSNLRYTYAGNPLSELGQVTQTPASRAMFGDEGAAMQPWATGQQVPAGLLNYQIPGGPLANVSYSGGNPSLFDFNNQQNVTNQNNVVTNPLATDATQWVGVLPDGQRTNDFAAWSQAQHDAAYPGRQAAAMAAGFGGLNYWAPGAEDWRAALPGGDSSKAWKLAYGDLAAQEAGKTATEQLIDQGLITVKGK